MHRHTLALGNLACSQFPVPSSAVCVRSVNVETLVSALVNPADGCMGILGCDAP